LCKELGAFTTGGGAGEWRGCLTNWKHLARNAAPAQVNPKALACWWRMEASKQRAATKPISTFFGQPFDVIITGCDDAAEKLSGVVGSGQAGCISLPDPAEVVVILKRFCTLPSDRAMALLSAYCLS